MHAAFLHAVRDHPDDDTPRLVYADWLAENGDEARGDLIRAQCRSDDATASALLRDHEARWRAALPLLDGITWGAFLRGFVEEVTAATPHAFLANAGAILAASPVRRLRILNARAGLEALAASPSMLALVELNLGNRSGVPADAVRALARSPHFANITSLLLHQNNLGNAALVTLATTPHTGQLRDLYVSGVGVGDSGVAALVNGHLALDLLDLRDNFITDAGASAFAAWPGHGPVTLQFSNNRVGPPGGTALALSSSLSRLARLHLDHNFVGDEAARAFARSPHRAALRELDLRGCGVTDDGALALAGSPLARQLQHLDLSGNPIRRRDTLHALHAAFGRRLHV